MAGRQVRFRVDTDEFIFDLLLFNVQLLCFVIVDIKIDKFRPEYAGQLGFYVEAFDDLHRPEHLIHPIIGILICSRDLAFVRTQDGSNRPTLSDGQTDSGEPGSDLSGGVARTWAQSIRRVPRPRTHSGS